MTMKNNIDQLIDLCEKEYQKRAETGKYVTNLGFKPEARASQIRAIIELLEPYIIVKETEDKMRCPRCGKFCAYIDTYCNAEISLWKCKVCGIKMEVPNF